MEHTKTEWSRILHRKSSIWWDAIWPSFSRTYQLAKIIFTQPQFYSIRTIGAVFQVCKEEWAAPGLCLRRKKFATLADQSMYSRLPALLHSLSIDNGIFRDGSSMGCGQPILCLKVFEKVPVSLQRKSKREPAAQSLMWCWNMFVLTSLDVWEKLTMINRGFE